MVYTKKQLGDLITKARKIRATKTGKKYTQDMLAKDIGFSRGYIGDIESGRTYPNYVLLNKIAEACDVPLSFFDDNNFSMRLQKLQKDAGLSRQELSDKTGISFNDLSYYEIDPLSKPSDNHVKILSSFFGVSSNFLLGLPDDKTIDKNIDENISTDTVEFDTSKYIGPLTEDEIAAVNAFLISYRNIKNNSN
jgi:transcriptional regulator with XRE-family HTH domain